MSVGKFDVDRGLCQAYGVCAAAAPDHVGLDEEGEPVPRDIVFETPPPDVEQALRSCPAGAAKINYL